MYHHMYGWNHSWAWMVPMMLLWLVIIGAVVYAAVRLATQHEHNQKPPLQH